MQSSSLTPDVVVLGAGAAGLAAARDLADAGISTLVLEGRARLGGRIFTRHQGPAAIEFGAEFIHGRAPVLEAIGTDARLTSVEVEGSRWRASDGRLRPLDDFWSRLAPVMHAVMGGSRDRTFDEGLRSARARRLPADDRRLARQFVEGFHAADAARASVHALADGGDPAEDVREQRLGRFLDGYTAVIAWLAQPVMASIRLSTTVTAVRWAQGRVRVEARDARGREHRVTARAAIVALPLGVLQAEPPATAAVEFTPSLRTVAAKRTALDHLASGHAVRITIRFSERFWTDDAFASRVGAQGLDTLSFLHTGSDDFPVWWTSYPVRSPFMVGWCGGPRAVSLSELDPERLLSRACAALAGQLGTSTAWLRQRVDGWWTHDWVRDPFSRGAYSYTLVNGAGAHAALARPVRQTLFFAGEATDTGGATGTVHGAIASGQRAAAEVMRALGRRTRTRRSRRR